MVQNVVVHETGRVDHLGDDRHLPLQIQHLTSKKGKGGWIRLIHAGKPRMKLTFLSPSTPTWQLYACPIVMAMLGLTALPCPSK